MSKKSEDVKDIPKEEVKEEVKKEEPSKEETEITIEALKQEIYDLKNKYAMAYADTENLKKRLQAEADSLKKYRSQSFMTDILPAIDNFERAHYYA